MNSAIPPQVSPLELVPESIVEPLDFGVVFGRVAPVEIDIGCGDGAFLVEMARLHTDRDFLGTERLLGRVRRVCRRAGKLGLRNIRVLQLESLYTTRYLLPPGSVSVIHVLFPDPWPKRRHNVRRLVQREFLDAACTALIPGGILNLVTDDADYAAHMRDVADSHPGFRPAPAPPDLEYPETDFERRFREQGLSIHRFRLERVFEGLE